MIAAWEFGVIALAFGAGVSTGMRIEQREHKDRGKRPGEGVMPNGPMPAATPKPRDAAWMLTREERQAMVDHYFESEQIASRLAAIMTPAEQQAAAGLVDGPRGVYDPGTGTWREP